VPPVGYRQRERAPLSGGDLGDCNWRDRFEDLEDLTDEEVMREINRYYDGGWIQFCRRLSMLVN
jgi:hypothetical protein